MKQNERSYVRKRPQQLLYLELERDNGGILLNLSEDGCAFQAISPVSLGKTRFGFQISGGRPIAGDAEVKWADELGIVGGLQFLDIQVELRELIRVWLNETNAPQEPEAEVVPAVTLPVDTRSGVPPTVQSKDHSASSRRLKEMRPSALAERTACATDERQMPSAHIRTPVSDRPILEDVRARFPLLRGNLTSRSKSGSVWGRIALLTMLALALLYVFQREVPDSLISLVEKLIGKSGVPAVVRESQPSETASPGPETNVISEKPESHTAPNEESEVASIPAPDSATPVVLMENAQRTEQQAVRHDVSAGAPPNREPGLTPESPRSENESVASLWESVQGGSVSAELSLAEHFVRGEGVPRNCEQARVLLKAAAGTGNREARLRLYQLESGGCQ
jgi:PilZ domain